MSRARKPRSVAIELPHSGAERGSGTCVVRYDMIRSSASSTPTVDARTCSVSPDFSCISRTTSNIPSSSSSLAWITTSTPSPRMLRLGSVTSAATSIRASCPRSSPVISQSIHTRRSLTGDSLSGGHTGPTLRDRSPIPYRCDDQSDGGGARPAYGDRAAGDDRGARRCRRDLGPGLVRQPAPRLRPEDLLCGHQLVGTRAPAVRLQRLGPGTGTAGLHVPAVRGGAHVPDGLAAPGSRTQPHH